MTENPHDAPSSVVVPTENVEKPLRKRATWRILLFVMFLPTFLVTPFEIRLWLNPIATPIAVWAGSTPPRLPRPLFAGVKAIGAFLLCGFVEWFFYGWLLDTWTYRRRLAK